MPKPTQPTNQNPKGALYETHLCYPHERFRQTVHIFDNNLLKKFNTPAGEGLGLGDLLTELRDRKNPREAVVLLPAIAEANYRRMSSVKEILNEHRIYFEPHFGKYGIRDASAFSYGDECQSGAEALLQIMIRVLLNYWVVCTAHLAFDKRRNQAARPAALGAFFTQINEANCLPKSKFPLLVAATILAGNGPAAGAINIKTNDVALLMNGSWDMLYWHCLTHLTLEAITTGCVPRFYSYDDEAVGIFVKMQLKENGIVRFVYDGDTAEDTLNEVIEAGIASVRPSRLSGRDLVEKIHSVLPAQFKEGNYLKARSLALDCLDQVEQHNSLLVLARPPK